jgi:hypothetical protein
MPFWRRYLQYNPASQSESLGQVFKVENYWNERFTRDALDFGHGLPQDLGGVIVAGARVTRKVDEVWPHLARYGVVPSFRSMLRIVER